METRINDSLPVKASSCQAFFLAKFSDLAKRNFKMAKDMCFSCFLVTMFSTVSLFLSIARFLYWILAFSKKPFFEASSATSQIWKKKTLVSAQH